MKIYGIKNCDTVKKARLWLQDHQVDYSFHDFRADGIDRSMVERWLAAAGPEVLINRRGTTWKSLDSHIRDTLDSQDIPALLVAHPTLIKRPVLEVEDRVLVGFSAKSYNEFFGF